MTQTVSIVLVDKRHYRKIAQEHWGLSDEQMKGMHVHHRIPLSEGGTNDPSNLYVCSPWFHAHIWHTEQFWIETQLKAAIAGGYASNREKDENGKSISATVRAEKGFHKDGRDENGRSITMLKRHQVKDEGGKSLLAKRANQVLHKEKTEDGKSLHAVSQFEKKNASGVPLRTIVMGMGRFRTIEVLDIVENISFTFDQLIVASLAMDIPKTSLRRLADEEGRVYKNRFKARWWSSTF
jgi:hypothetical protein